MSLHDGFIVADLPGENTNSHFNTSLLALSQTRGATMSVDELRQQRVALQRDYNLFAVQYSIGIIDFLQNWSTKKIIAHYIKKYTIGLFHEIDTEPPNVYSERFRLYVQRQILSADQIALGQQIHTTSKTASSNR